MKTVSNTFKQLLATSITGSFLLAAALPLTAQEFGQNPRPDSHETIQDVKELARDFTPPSSEEPAGVLAESFIFRAVDAGRLDTGMGWNDQAEVFVAVGTANYMTDNPATDQNFAQMRAIKGLEASLRAKSDIIRYVRTELSFENTVILPESGLGTDFDAERFRVESELDAALSEYEATAMQLDQLSEEGLSEVSFADLVRHGLGGLIETRINPDFNMDALQDGDRERLAQVRARLDDMERQLNDLKAQAEQMQEERVSEESAFAVETFAAMALTGAVMVGQFETWDAYNGFEIAVVYMWSPEQEIRIRNILAGRESTTRPGRQSLGQFIQGNDWSTAIGSRKFVDNTGQLHVIGIGAWPLAGNSSAQRRRAEGFARNLAMSQVALAFSGDVAARDQASAMSQEIENVLDETTRTEVAESFAENLSQSTQMSLQGVQQRFSRVVNHPISGQRIHVIVASASASQTAVAAEMEAALFSGAAETSRLQQRSRGVRAGMEERLQEERADTTAFTEGHASGRGSAASESATPQQQQQTEPAQSSPGSVTGAGSDIDAFGW